MVVRALRPSNATSQSPFEPHGMGIHNQCRVDEQTGMFSALYQVESQLIDERDAVYLLASRHLKQA